MMIFDANSGEFWQIFARQGMRNLRNSLLERGEVCIEDVELELKSRDDVPALLVGPQYLYSQLDFVQNLLTSTSRKSRLWRFRPELPRGVR